MIINESDNDSAFELINTTVISNIQNFLGKGSDWIIDSVIEYNIGISKYNSLAGSCYIRLPKDLDHPKKDLLIFKILIINKDLNEV